MSDDAPPRLPRDPDRWTRQYPLHKMKRDESMFIEGVSRTAVSVQASRVGRRYEPRMLFSCHVVEENGVKGVKVWRVQ